MQERDRVKIAVDSPAGRREVRGTVVHVSPVPAGDPDVTISAGGLEYHRHASEILEVFRGIMGTGPRPVHNGMDEHRGIPRFGADEFDA